MSKTFVQAPKPKPLTDEAIAAFERGGVGQDTQTHIATKEDKGKRTKIDKSKTTNAENTELTRRLSINLPVSLHRRFKTACSKTDTTMLAEVANLIRRRTIELEKT